VETKGARRLLERGLDRRFRFGRCRAPRIGLGGGRRGRDGILDRSRGFRRSHLGRRLHRDLALRHVDLVRHEEAIAHVDLLAHEHLFPLPDADDEARAFVAKATQDRARQQLASDKARAQTTPLPSTVAPADKAKSQATEASKAKTVAGAFVSKLGAGMGIRRTSSAPGKKRADVPEAAFPATGAATPTEAIGEGDEKLVPTTTVTESEKTEVGSDEEKKDVVVAMGAQEVLITTASSTPLGGSHVALPPATASAPTLSLPTSTPTGTINALPPPAMLAEALERGRKRGPPGALLVPSNATPGAGVGVGGRIPSVSVSGASTPVGAGSGGPVKKKTFKVRFPFLQLFSFRESRRLG